MKIVFCLALLISAPTWASAPCSEVSSHEIKRIQISPQLSLVACAELTKGTVHNLTLLSVRGKVIEHVFDGDSAWKSYAVEIENKTLVVTESLNSKGAKPYVEIKATCLGDKCSTTERCIWKKGKSDEAALSRAEAQSEKKNPLISDQAMDEIFYAALNGSARAFKFLSSNLVNGDAAGSESFETYKSDLQRLKNAGCF